LFCWSDAIFYIAGRKFQLLEHRRRPKLGLCDAGHSGHDPTHFESLSILKQYSTNEFMNGKAIADARSADFQGKMC
jgi:hypothetical protein